MKTFINALIIVLGTIATIAFFALLGGTLVWLLWPVAVPVVFPGLVAAGTISGKLTWWVAVCLTWLCSLLIKSSTTVNNSRH